ncbi:uncharacterized protein [Lepeophtheirus salmonis]|uniref:uncharacterized protein n=1 Tax=Lepeophtheirus salmonis TaxID=72036 RepID=UPI001AE36E6C|nr:basic proline-rich protein-like [Lepeophtheirus salmonis]
MKVFIVLAFLAVSATAQYPTQYPASAPVPVAPQAAYNFNYNVVDDETLNFGLEEDRNGAETHGEYRVALPDGRTQIVTYQVIEDSGFVADVKYEGEVLPFTPPQPAPSKPAPPPPAVYKPLPPPPPPPAPKPAPVYYRPRPSPPAPAPEPKPAPVYYRPLPSPPPSAPAPAPRPAPPRKEYGPVRFNPFG